MTQLTATEIKEGMTPLPWDYLGKKSFRHIESANTARVAGVHVCSINKKNIYDLEAIVTAVNSTYGKGLDPEKMKDCVNELERLIPLLQSHSLPTKRIEQLLQSAKIK